MRKVCCSLILCFFIGGAYAQNVAVVNRKPISKKEFMWFYKKNHPGNAGAAYKDLEAYLNLYVNFKLKVLDAKELGLDKDTAYLTEVENYEHALRAQRGRARSNSEYVLIVNEYRDAVLMFNISEIKVWNKAQNDENQLLAFYDKNKNVYLQRTFDEAKGDVISDYGQSLEKEWVETLRKQYPAKINQDEIRKLTKL